MAMRKVKYKCQLCAIPAHDDGPCVFTAIVEDGCVFVPELCPVANEVRGKKTIKKASWEKYKR